MKRALLFVPVIFLSLILSAWLPRGAAVAQSTESTGNASSPGQSEREAARQYTEQYLQSGEDGDWLAMSMLDPETLTGEAEKGDVHAQYALGSLYLQGGTVGFRRDKTKAATWFRKAAEQGHAPSRFSLGTIYFYGMDVPQDYAEAAKWFAAAAKQGNASAQYFLGDMYAEGRGVPKDDAEAARWFKLSADQGSVAAQFVLGTMYGDGRGVRRDPSAAAEWFFKAGEAFLRDERYDDARKCQKNIEIADPGNPLATKLLAELKSAPPDTPDMAAIADALSHEDENAAKSLLDAPNWNHIYTFGSFPLSPQTEKLAIGALSSKKDAVRELAFKTLSIHGGYVAQSAWLDMLNRTPPDVATVQFLSSMSGRPGDPRLAPTILDLVKHAKTGEDGVLPWPMSMMAGEIGSFGYAPAADTLVEIVSRQAVGDWWNDEYRRNSVPNLLDALAAVGDRRVTALYNRLMEDAARASDTGKPSAPVWLPETMFTACSTMWDKKTAEIFLGYLSGPDSPNVGDQSLYGGLHDTAEVAFSFALPGTRDCTADDYRKLLDRLPDIDAYYFEQLRDPDTPWRGVLRFAGFLAVRGRRSEALSLLEAARKRPENAEGLPALSLAFSAAWHGNMDALESLVDRGRNPADVFEASEAARARKLAGAYFYGCDEYWDKWFAAARKELHWDLYTHSWQPADAWERITRDLQSAAAADATQAQKD